MSPFISGRYVQVHHLIRSTQQWMCLGWVIGYQQFIAGLVPGGTGRTWQFQQQNNESNRKNIKLSMTVAFEEAQGKWWKMPGQMAFEPSCSNTFEIDFCRTWPWLAGVWWTWAYRVRNNRPLHKITICAEILSNCFIAIKYDWSTKRLSDYPWQGVWLPSCNIRGRSVIDHILKCADSGVCSCDVVSEVEKGSKSSSAFINLRSSLFESPNIG